MSIIPIPSPKEDNPSDKNRISFWDRIPFHPFFFVLYPLLFLVSHNGLSLWDGVPLLSAICLVVTVFFGVLLYFFLRNARHIGVILSVWVILFFWIVPFCDFLRMSLPLKIGLSAPYYFLLCYPIGTIILWRRKGNFYFATRLLNSISAILVILAFAGIGFNVLSIAKDNQTVLQRQNQENFLSQSEAGREIDTSEQPDIYLIICDAYSGQYAMEKLHHYDNLPFLSELEKRGFQVVPCSSSNYNVTKFSIPSILNMDYLDEFIPLDELKTNDEFRLKRICFARVFENKLIDDLRPKGYRYVHVMNGYQRIPVDMKNPPEFMVSSSNNGEFFSLFYDMTLLSVILHYDIHQSANRRETLNMLQILKTMPEKYGSEPFLTCVHIIAPQEPYCFKADGTKQRFYYSQSRLSTQDHNEMYVEQLRFINNELLKVFDTILSQSKRDPVIVLMSDHASRLSAELVTSSLGEEEKNALASYNNLIAIRLPNGMLLDYSEEMTNVNVFRTILNAVFHENHEILEPRYFAGKDKDTEITQDIRGVFEKWKASPQESE